MKKQTVMYITLVSWICFFTLCFVNIWAFIPGERWVQTGTGWNNDDGSYPIYSKEKVISDIFPHNQLWASIALIAVIAVSLSLNWWGETK